MSGTQIESWGSAPQLDETNILQEKLKKIQIPGFSDEILQKILANPQAKVDFVRDINALASQNPPNPSEISRMELLYIKGYRQEVTLKDGSKMSFADLLKMKDGKEEVIERMSDGEFSAYEIFLNTNKQVANQEADQVALRKQAAIDEIIQKIPQIIPVYEQQLAAGKKLTMDQKGTLTYILSINKPPEWMSRVQKLLANPQNFA